MFKMVACLLHGMFGVTIGSLLNHGTVKSKKRYYIVKKSFISFVRFLIRLSGTSYNVLFTKFTKF